ncbi:MAG TPA: BBP7 family outer membrane beta-barrel protein [Pirellulales bacterium]|nr:BBP7 family outer membrane beta-barrel protein [Pirellulales bacterium]
MQRIVRIAIGIGSLALMCPTGSAAQAQFAPQSEPDIEPPGRFCASVTSEGVDPGIWGRFEYLNLWAKGATLPAPLATAGGSAGQGRLGAADTTVLLDQVPDFSVIPGGRLTIGGWAGFDEETWGGELTVFETALRAAHFNVASAGVGGPWLAVPFARTTPSGVDEASLVVAQPGVSHGQIGLDDALVLGGIEADAMLSLSDFLPGDRGRFNLLGGIGAFFLKERMQFVSNSVSMLGTSSVHSDIFLANNSFFGGDFGARYSYRWRRVLFELTGRTAIGVNTPTLYVAGQSGLPFYTPRPNLLAPEGFFAQPTNAGTFWVRNAFAVIPNTQIRVGYDLTRHLRLTLGYEALLWTRVLRAGDQLDWTVNLSQLTGPLVGPARPAVQTRASDFWAQGFTVGFQLNY